MSVGVVVVDGGAVVVVEGLGPVAPVFGDVVVLAAPLAPVVPVFGAVVVVVVGGATNGVVSPVMEAALAEGVAERLVQPRAPFQLCTAAAAGAPVSGWGSPARIVAGRNVAPVMWRPTAVRINAPLEVSGGVLS